MSTIKGAEGVQKVDGAATPNPDFASYRDITLAKLKYRCAKPGEKHSYKGRTGNCHGPTPKRHSTGIRPPRRVYSGSVGG